MRIWDVAVARMSLVTEGKTQNDKLLSTNNIYFRSWTINVTVTIRCDKVVSFFPSIRYCVLSINSVIGDMWNGWGKYGQLKWMNEWENWKDIKIALLQINYFGKWLCFEQQRIRTTNESTSKHQNIRFVGRKEKNRFCNTIYVFFIKSTDFKY